MTQSIACVSAFDLLLLVLLGAIWGASFLFIRVAAPVLGPIALVGAFSYAVAAVYTGRTFLRLPPISLAVNQLIVSGTILLLPAIATRTAAPLDPAALASAVALALLGTSVGYLIYFRLIERTGPTRAITVTLLIPIFGVLLGHLVLGEPVRPGLLAGLALILLGVSLVNGLLPAARRVHVPTTGAGAASD